MRSVSCKCLDKSLVYTFFSNLFQNYGHANLTASFKVIDSIHWLDSLIRLFHSIHWTKINQQKSFLEEQRKIKVKTWTKINQQNIFLEGHFKTIGKWVQKRQTLIFTVANVSLTKNATWNLTLMVKPDEFSNGDCGRGPSCHTGGCTLCVCFLGDPSLMCHENPKK